MQIWSLPVATYPDVAAVLTALGLLSPPVRARYRAQPPGKLLPTC